MLGDPVALRRVVGEEPRGPSVCPLTLGLAELFVDGVADDRVLERQGPAGTQDAGSRQQLGGLEGVVLAEAGQTRGEMDVAFPEHRERTREPAGALGKPRQAKSDRPGHRTCAHALDLRHCLGARGDAFFRDRGEQRTKHEGRPERGPGASLDECRIGRRAQRRLHQRGHRVDRERRQPQHVGRRVSGHAREHVRVAPQLARAGADEEGDRQLLEPGDQERERPEGGRVGPLRVIDENAHRARGGEVRGEPVEPVKDPEQRVDFERRRTVAAEEQGRGRPRRPVQETRPGLVGRLGENRLEQLPHDPEGELALELRAARTKHAHALGLCFFPRGRQHGRLADPRWAFDDDESAAAGPRLCESARYSSKLRLPLEERCPRWRLSHNPSLSATRRKVRGGTPVRIEPRGSNHGSRPPGYQQGETK
jgi:hypothetical protein